MKRTKKDKEWRRKDWIKQRIERRWELCVYVWGGLVGGGMYVRLCVRVLLFTVALTIWPGFFICIFWGSSPTGFETLLFLLRFIILIILPPLFPNIPLRAWRRARSYISNDVQMPHNKIYFAQKCENVGSEWLFIYSTAKLHVRPVKGVSENHDGQREGKSNCILLLPLRWIFHGATHNFKFLIHTFVIVHFGGKKYQLYRSPAVSLLVKIKGVLMRLQSVFPS